MDNNSKMAALVVTTLTFLPFWRSGNRANLTFWGFLLNHTIYGPPVEYVPEEDYENALSTRLSRRG